jgi:hypothetical protein
MSVQLARRLRPTVSTTSVRGVEVLALLLLAAEGEFTKLGP